MQRSISTPTALRRRLAGALAVAAFALVAAGQALAQAPWDGTPISQGFGPTYGDPWCAPPTEPGVGPQQGAPLALMPQGATLCSLQKFQQEAAAAGIPQRMTFSQIGTSAGGRPLYGVVVNGLETPQQQQNYARYQQLRALELENPTAALALLASWGGEVKMPVFIEANIHGNEEEGADAMMQAIRDLVTTPRGTSAIVDKILDYSVLVVIPVMNPDGRYLGIRQNENRFDMNRDFLVQSQPEVKANVRLQQQWLATNGLALHGYYNPTLNDGLTKPHNPGIEYDIFVKWNQRRLDHNEAHVHQVPGRPGSARPGVHQGYGMQRPVNDWCAGDHPMWFTTDQSWWTTGIDPACPGGTPPGPAVAEGWDDWGPFYTQTYISLLGIDGSTVEMCRSTALQPVWNADSNPDLDDGAQCGGEGRLGSKKMQYVIFYSSMDYWLDNRAAMMRDQVEIYRRGVANAPRPRCCDDPLIASRGFDEANHNWMVEYPRAYVIPFEGGGQRSDAEANRLVQWLLDNGIEVTRATSQFTWGGTTYPAGTYVVWMNQALRGLAYTALAAGQDISARIHELYAPPGAWSHGLLWGADVVEVPRGAVFSPPSTRVTAPNPLTGGIRGGATAAADFYSVTLRGPREVAAVLDLLRSGVTGEMAEAPFTSTTGGDMPAGTLIFPRTAQNRIALSVVGAAAGIWFERNVGVAKPPTTLVEKAPRIAVLVNSATPETSTTTRPIHEVLESIFGSDLVGFVSTVTGPNSLQNAASDPLARYDVIYNTGVSYPTAANAQARARLSAFFARGGGYIGTAQSAANFTFLTDAGLVSGAFTRGIDDAFGGIALWDNVGGAASPLTGGYPSRDTLFLPSNVTYFSAVPAGAVVDGRYVNSTSAMWIAGLWRDRDPAVAGSPMIVHGTTNNVARYMGLATDPLSRHDAEREWTLVGQAALWSTLTDEANSNVVFPAEGGEYGHSRFAAGCPGGAGFCGTATGAPGPAIERVEVAVQRVSTGLWWNGSAFASATPVYANASGAANWFYAFPSSNFPEDGEYVVRSRAITVGGNQEITPNSARFLFDTTRPTVDVRQPVEGAVYAVGQVVAADYACADAGSGVSSCIGTVPNGSRIHTSTRGRHEFTVTSVDEAGNRTVQTVSYVVAPLTCSVQVGGKRPVAKQRSRLVLRIAAYAPDRSTAQPARPVGVTLRGAGVNRTVTANRNGVATVVVRPRRAGTIRVAASAPNMDACRTAVRVRPAPPAGATVPLTARP